VYRGKCVLPSQVTTVSSRLMQQLATINGYFKNNKCKHEENPR